MLKKKKRFLTCNFQLMIAGFTRLVCITYSLLFSDNFIHTFEVGKVKFDNNYYKTKTNLTKKKKN